MDGYFGLPGHKHFRRFVLFFVYLDAWKFSFIFFTSSSNFCHIPFIKITDDGLGIRQVFWVSGVWTLVDGLDLIFASEGRRLGHETSFIDIGLGLDLVSVPLSGSEVGKLDGFEVEFDIGFFDFRIWD
ncbi:unnamed protein product [Rhizophagus irregularis]|nr:unnamed protein product [Rhizophagus irregularis]